MVVIFLPTMHNPALSENIKQLQVERHLFYKAMGEDSWRPLIKVNKDKEKLKNCYILGGD